MVPFPVDPLEFFVWLAAPVTHGLLVTLVLERWEWFQALSSLSKRRFVLGYFIAMQFVSVGIVAFFQIAPLELPSDARGWVLWFVGLVLQGLVGWMASQYGHEQDPQTRANRLAGE